MLVGELNPVDGSSDEVPTNMPPGKVQYPSDHPGRNLNMLNAISRADELGTSGSGLPSPSQVPTAGCPILCPNLIELDPEAG